MYTPPQFNSTDRAIAAELMRAHPFATLISNDDDGLPYITHLPLVLDDRGEDGFALLGHCAKPNAHWRYLRARPTAVVSFLGPHAYLSPSVYPDLARVPTWNYLAVHLYGTLELLDPEDSYAVMAATVDRYEAPVAEPVHMPDVEGYARRIAPGAVGFRLAVTRWQGKAKLSQDKPRAVAERVVEHLGTDPHYAEPALAAEMRAELDRRPDWT